MILEDPKMQKFSKPEAAAAVRLAEISPRVTRSYVTARIEAGDCPRALYVLACVLRASRQVSQARPRSLGVTE